MLDGLRQCRRAGLYEQGKAISETGGLKLAQLSDEQQIEAEDDYRICVRRGNDENRSRSGFRLRSGEIGHVSLQEMLGDIELAGGVGMERTLFAAFHLERLAQAADPGIGRGGAVGAEVAQDSRDQAPVILACRPGNHGVERRNDLFRGEPSVGLADQGDVERPVDLSDLAFLVARDVGVLRDQYLTRVQGVEIA